MVWLVNYIPEPIRKSVGGFKDKIINLFKTNTLKQTEYGQNHRKPFASEEDKEKSKIE